MNDQTRPVYEPGPMMELKPQIVEPEAVDIDDDLIKPPMTEAPVEHPLWPQIMHGLRSVYDPEIPVNIYELGLIYKVGVSDGNNIRIEMTLTAPGCPVAGDMPAYVEDALDRVDGHGTIEVELVWDPPWNPAMMAETARMALDMW